MKKFLNVLRIIIGIVMLISNIGLLFFHFSNTSNINENPISVFAQILIAFLLIFPKMVYWGNNMVLRWVFPICAILFLLWFGGYASLSGLGKDLFKTNKVQSSSEQLTEVAKELSSKVNVSEFVNKQMDILHETSQEINAKCPMKIDAQTRLDNTVAGPGLKFTYYYTLIGMPNYNKDIDKKLYNFTKNHYRTNNNLKLSIGMGVTYCNKYRNEDGSLLYHYCFDKNELEKRDDNVNRIGQKITQDELNLETIYSTPSIQKLNELSERIKKSPDESMHYYNRGVYYMAAKEYKLAMKDFNMAINLDSNSALAYGYRGHTRICIGDNKGAIEDCGKAINLTDFWGVFYFIRAKAYLGINEYEKAVSDLKTSAAKKYRPAKIVLIEFGLMD